MVYNASHEITVKSVMINPKSKNIYKNIFMLKSAKTYNIQLGQERKKNNTMSKKRA